MSSRPPFRFQMRLRPGQPWPVPRRTSRRCKDGSRIRFRCSTSIPVSVSASADTDRFRNQDTHTCFRHGIIECADLAGKALEKQQLLPALTMSPAEHEVRLSEEEAYGVFHREYGNEPL